MHTYPLRKPTDQFKLSLPSKELPTMQKPAPQRSDEEIRKTFLEVQAKYAANRPHVPYSERFEKKQTVTGRTTPGRRFANQNAKPAAPTPAKPVATDLQSPELRATLHYLEGRAGKGHRFSASLLEGFRKYGSLTTGQLAAVQRMQNEDGEREYLQSDFVHQAPVPVGLDLSCVPAGRYGVPNGQTRLKVRIDKPEAPSRWAGYVFVSDGADYGEQRKYGRQAPGRRYEGEIVEQLRTIAADPLAAAKEYGRLTGRCCICNRKLEDVTSVANGIGPICAKKFTARVL